MVSIVIIIILIAFSAFFSMSETAFTSLNRVQVQTQANEGDKRAQLIIYLADNYDRLISTILVGNNIVNIGASSVATTLFTQASPRYGALISTIVMTIVVLIFGEITPKTVAKDNSSRIARATSPILNFFMKIFSPIVWILNQITGKLASFFESGEEELITDEELLYIIGEAEESGSLTDYEHDLISSAIKIDDVKAEAIMVPRPRVHAIDVNQPEEEIKSQFYSNKYSRLLIYDGTIDNTLGVVHEKVFSRYLLGIGENQSFEDCISEVMVVYPWQRITLILDEMQESGIHFAVVKGEYGETLGILTLEDILEELVGKIWDETDTRYENFRRNEDGTFTILGTVYADQVFDYFNIDAREDRKSSTIGGYIVEELGDFAQLGDTVEVDGAELIVEEVDNRRVAKVRIDLGKDRKIQAQEGLEA